MSLHKITKIETSIEYTYKFTIIIKKAHSFGYPMQSPCIILIPAKKDTKWTTKRNPHTQLFCFSITCLLTCHLLVHSQPQYTDREEIDKQWPDYINKKDQGFY